jgi:hypothetical protein
MRRGVRKGSPDGLAAIISPTQAGSTSSMASGDEGDLVKFCTRYFSAWNGNVLKSMVNRNQGMSQATNTKSRHRVHGGLHATRSFQLSQGNISTEQSSVVAAATRLYSGHNHV